MENIVLENILLRYKLGQKTLEESIKEILLLFNINGRNEQSKVFDELLDYAWNLAQHPEEQVKLNEIRERF